MRRVGTRRAYEERAPPRLEAARLPAMHAIFFGLKRAHHGALRITRTALAQLGLTAARFDLMYAIHGRRAVRQRALRRMVGVSAPTVSRMLASLEELGLVKREVALHDRRQRWVRLTDVGRRCIRKAIRRFIRWGAAQLAVDSALCPDTWCDRDECFLAMQACDSSLGRIRGAYGDVATLDYPWHPEDVGTDEDVEVADDPIGP
jgi:DNA-binding MarR family transcriptional regulator